MASTIAAITTGVGGIVQSADASGNLSLLSGTTTIVAVTSAGAAVTGTLGASGAVSFSTTLGVTGVATLGAGAILNTPASATLTNATGLPIVAGTTGTLSVARGGSGVTTATGTGNTVLSDNATLVAPALGTPASGNLANCTGVVITNKIQPITASVAASALTITLNPTVLDFRSATLTSGAVTTIAVPAAISVTIPSTSTMGTVSAVQSRIVVIAINNAGTVELAAVNISGGSVLDETTLITTTAAVAAGNSATAYYSTTARTSVAYRVVGYVESTQATAGTWATAPSTLQGYGGQALAAMSSLGYGQTWQSFVFGTTRIHGTTYYNTTGRPIQLSLSGAQANSGQEGSIFINGISLVSGSAMGIGAWVAVQGVVPVGGSYYSSQPAGTWTPSNWRELR